MRGTSSRRLALAAAVAVLAAVAARCVPAQAAVPPGFRWFEPIRAPAKWKRLSPPAGGAILSYPASFRRIRSDRLSVAVGTQDGQGRVVLYLNATPRQGAETLRGWPDFRLRHNRAESSDVHELARAYGLPFVGGRGSCVMDDYSSRVKVNHYREIACFVQGPNGAGVVVAAALRSQWKRAAPLLERAVEAYQLV